MTEITFYLKSKDRLMTISQLCKKIINGNRTATILTPDDETTDRVSHILWTQPKIGFYPHCRSGHKLATRTPIIVDHTIGAETQRDIVINLCDSPPDNFSQYRRVIEIVDETPKIKELARTRYIYYRDRGYEIRSHKL